MANDFKKVLSGSFLVAGTTIGAGMLGIPLFTSVGGFWPAVGITLLAWFFMLCTGLLYLEACLWMPLGSNFLSLSKRYLGGPGKWFTGGMFIFLYYFLLIAYFAAGAPLLGFALEGIFGFHLDTLSELFLFGLIFGAIVALGAKWIDRTNLLLTAGLIGSYLLLMGVGSSAVEGKNLAGANWSPVFLALPVLFSAFGYHNIIPSLCSYFEKRERPLRLSIIIGTIIALVIYLLWQLIIIGSVPQEKIAQTLAEGKPATWALQAVAGHPLIFKVGQAFAFFAIVTSLLGVAFSMVDFLKDGLKKVGRFWLVLLTFVPPFLCALYDPKVFDAALGIAGGFGEAILNGLLPVSLVWIGRGREHRVKDQLPGGRPTLFLLGVACLGVLMLELLILS